MSYPVESSESEFAPASASQFDIKKFIFKLVGFLPWIILSVIISYSIARIYLRYTPQMHKVASYVLIKDDQQNSSDNKILEDLGVMPDSKEVQNQIDIFQSYNLLAGIVDSLNLQVQLVDEGRIASSPLYGNKMPVRFAPVKSDTSKFLPGSFKLNLFDKKFSIPEHGKIVFHNYRDTFLFAGRNVIVTRNNEVKIDPKGYNLMIRSYREIALGMKRGINVRLINQMGGIIEIALVDEIPERAIDIINKLVEAYNTAGLNDKNIAGYKTLDFITERIDSVSRDLDDVESTLDSYKRNNQITDISDDAKQYATQTSAYNTQEAEQQGELEILKSLEFYIRSNTSFTSIIPSARGLAEPTLLKLIDQYNDAVLEFQNQLKISTEKDPVLDRQKNNITEIKGNILKNIQSIKAGYNDKLAQLQSLRGNYSGLLASVPEKEKILVNLKRQRDVKEQLYNYLLQKKEETKLSLSSNINNTRTVDNAYDLGVVKPDTGQVKNFAFLIGLIVPIVVMLLLDFFNNKITDKKEIEAGTQAPVIGEISYDKNSEGTLISSKSRSVIAEQFRLVRTNLQYMAGDNPVKTILVTSFMSGEGKSFISINLAGNLAIGGAKVLLIELDLRKPKLSKYLDLKAELGLTDFIVNNFDPERILSQSALLPNVDIITSGPVPPNPTELLISKKLDALFEWAKNEYDYIVFDSSPVGLVADAFSLDKFSEINLFILRHTYSYKTTIKFVNKLYQEKRFKNLGLIINGITNVRGMGYGYGYGYGYSYGYGYHYGNGYYGTRNTVKQGIFDKLFSFFKKK